MLCAFLEGMKISEATQFAISRTSSESQYDYIERVPKRPARSVLNFRNDVQKIVANLAYSARLENIANPASLASVQILKKSKQS